MRINEGFVALLLVGAQGCSANGLVSRSQPVSHLPEIVRHSIQLNRVDGATPMVLRFVMPLQNETGLDQFIEDVSNPQSTSYRQYLTPDLFAAQFHPTAATVQRLREGLIARGIQPAESAHGAILEAVGTARDMEARAHTTLYQYAKPDGTRFFAPSTEVQFPEELPIRALAGLHSAVRYRSNLHREILATPAATTAPQIFSPAQLRAAYAIPSGVDGTGQVLGLLELDGYLTSDVQGFATQFGLPTPSVQNFLLDGYNGAAGSSSDEVTLDIQMMNLMAPAAQVRVYEAPNNQAFVTSMEDIWNEMANPSMGDKVMPTIASCSWYYLETQVTQADITQEQTIFKQMIAQGQTIFVAAGDAGATPDGGTTLSVEGPAAEPYAVAVGGTLLTTSAAGAYQSETTWFDSPNSQGGGGGISTLFAIPSYQVGLATAANKASTTMRNVPDVSLESGAKGGGIDFFFQGSLTSGWGTSFSAPLWAGYLALVDQRRAQNNLARTGFLNPILYRLGGSAQYNALFHDIADNSTNGFFPAVAGYDDATGWGTLNGGPLLTALSAGFARHTFVAPVGFFGP